MEFLDRPNVNNLSFQMDGGPLDHLRNINLECPNERQLDGPPTYVNTAKQ